ncbi:hypothetical protein BDZ45DRAFT_729656 [Acephala macrosclerotiorum]|nr:hypothetical protein BDZ45DRAFT_729656 [Acephala macrosclerotiorum]
MKLNDQAEPYKSHNTANMGLFSKSSSDISLLDDIEAPRYKSPDISPPIQPEQSTQPNPPSDLQRKIQIYEGTIEEQANDITTLNLYLDRERDQQAIFKAQISSIIDESRRETDTLKEDITSLEGQNHALREQLRDTIDGVQRLVYTCQEKDQELLARSSTIRGLRSHNQELQTRLAGLENMVALTGRDTRIDLQSFYDRYSALEKAHKELTPKCRAVEESCAAVQEMLGATQSENAFLRTVIEELHKEMSNQESCMPLTLRSLLMMRVIEQDLHAQGQPDNEPDGEVTTWVPTGLPQDVLDKIHNSSEIQDLADLLPTGRQFKPFYERLKFGFCNVCTKTKFSFKSDAHPRFANLKWLNEFPDSSRYFSCCHQKVCKECFKTKLLERLGSGWWHRLGTNQWFLCPREGCEEALGIRCEADLQICLERIIGIEADEHVKNYCKAMAFRQVLESFDSTPSVDALKKAAELAQHLINSNRMYSPFDPRFEPTLVDENGCIPDFNPGAVCKVTMENFQSQVPLFLKFFRRQTRSRECLGCSKAMFEIEYGDVETWKTTCESFQGSWMWNILVFPTTEIQKCDHEFQFCRVCTAEHIRGSLISRGPSACGNLSCPQCARKLNYQEILQLADAETVNRYEKFMLQIFLSHEPNFRWCLSPSCSNGQLYDGDDNTRDPKISCEECKFQMCFTHEMPWHEGQTCAEYESMRDHGDPAYDETREWIRTNTKPCPECGVGIQKGEACFHMTCSQCNHEFCWQCLASWTDVQARGQQGHVEGCFFRTADIRPTGIQGENLDGALRARNEGLRARNR